MGTRGSILLVLGLGVVVMGGATVAGLSCARVEQLEGGGGPRLRPRLDAGEPAQAECDRLGRTWVLDGEFAAGGYCTDSPPPPAPPALELHQLDAGAEVRS